MTELAEGESNSTVLEENVPAGVSGGGEPKLEPEEPTSLRDTLADELKKDAESQKEPAKDDAYAAKGADGDEDGEAEGKADKADKDDAKPKEKAEGDVKPAKERAEDGKFKAKEAKEAKDAKEAEGEKPGHYQAPEKFLPDAREKWLNVPKPVQRDIDNMAREHEAEVTQLREATQRYESIRQFDELAQSNGRDLTESLTKLNEIENVMQQNPYAGLNMILQEIGPRKPDGSPVSLYEVAQFVAQQGPDKWQQMVSVQPQQQQPQENPEVAQLKQQIAQMQVQQTAQSVIEPFKAEHPRYDELKGDIAMFLKSGRIPASLSAADRLEAAYYMAERLNPPSDVQDAPTKPSPDADRRVDDLSGTKSIKSAPGSASPDMAPQRGGSIADILREEARRSRRA